MMGFFGLFKKRLKKRFRMKRRWLSLGMLVVLLGGYFAYEALGESDPLGADGGVMAVFFQRGSLPESPQELRGEATVTVHRIYVCGQDEEVLGNLSAQQIVELSKEHPGWEFRAAARDAVVFTAHVDDLSAACKANSYIGVDDAGNLTLYEGPPADARVVKTFFQLNIEHLESALPDVVVNQLHAGIRITDIAEYNSVLSTFSDFAIDETEKVMKPEM
jgi:forespore regulator of the sigma-K checkpoint